MADQESATQSSESWRLIPLQVGDSLRHMALTNVLVASASRTGPAVWWHATNVSSVLIGPGAIKATMSDPAPMAIPVIPRPTGGGAVLVGPGVMGLDIALPLGHRLLSGDVVEDYAWIGRVWERTLWSFGIPCEALGISQARDMSKDRDRTVTSMACFGSYSAYEVVADRRKIVGLSQVRRFGGVLFSSAVHLDVHPGELVNALSLGPSQRRSLGEILYRRATSLNEAAPVPVSAIELMRGFGRCLTAMHGVRLSRGRWSSDELLQAEASLAAARRPTSM